MTFLRIPEIVAAQGDTLRRDDFTICELHILLKANDPSFGSLVRVINKYQIYPL